MAEIPWRTCCKSQINCFHNEDCDGKQNEVPEPEATMHSIPPRTWTKVGGVWLHHEFDHNAVVEEDDGHITFKTGGLWNVSTHNPYHKGVTRDNRSGDSCTPEAP